MATGSQFNGVRRELKSASNENIVTASNAWFESAKVMNANSVVKIGRAIDTAPIALRMISKT
jgi:hypothetical protein